MALGDPKHPRKGTELDPAMRMAKVMVDALDGHPDHDDETRAVAFVYPNEGVAGVGIHQYGDDDENFDSERLMADVFQSLDALLQMRGKSLAVVDLPQQGQG